MQLPRPHCTSVPQPSFAVPVHCGPHGFGFGEQQEPLKQTWPPPQLFGHPIVPPQPSGAVPLHAPPHAFVFGVQHEPPLHTWPPPQLFGHETWFPQLLVAVPLHRPLHAVPSSWQPHVLGPPPPQ